MRKSKKMLRLSAIAAIATIATVTGVSAASTSFTDKSVPTAQGYATLTAMKKSESSDYGIVNLSKMTPDAVTFSAKATASGHTYGAGKTVTQLNTDFYVYYTATYGEGQEMQARFRNHNWSLNSNKISGVFNYK